MRLAIADPPYPPRASVRADLAGGGTRVTMRSRAQRWYGAQATPGTAADFHPDAAEWDNPARHRLLLEQLHAEFDGWAIATTLDGLDTYAPAPAGTRHLIWHKQRALPNGSRIASACEAVLVYPHPQRRSRDPRRVDVPDLLSCAPPASGFPGAKPPEWTRWVLDALGYEPELDVLVDVFPGSGAVSAAAQAGVLL